MEADRRKLLWVGTVGQALRDRLSAAGFDIREVEPADLPNTSPARLADYEAVVLPADKPADTLPNVRPLLIEYNKTLRAELAANPRPTRNPWGRLVVLTGGGEEPAGDPGGPETLRTYLRAIRVAVPFEVRRARPTPDSIAEVLKPVAPPRPDPGQTLLFIQGVALKLDRWRRATSESQLYAARNRRLMDLKWVVEEAASAERPRAVAPVRTWCDQVFATHCFLKRWPVAFREGDRSPYVTAAGARGDEPDAGPDVALPPGLLVAVLVEVWAWVLGQGEDDTTCKLPDGKESLCDIAAAADPTWVGLTFRPLAGSGLAAPTPATELDTTLRHLHAAGYEVDRPAPGSFRLRLPVAREVAREADHKS